MSEGSIRSLLGSDSSWPGTQNSALRLLVALIAPLEITVYITSIIVVAGSVPPSQGNRVIGRLVCGFRRSRPGIPSVFRAPFQSDAAHQSNLMAPRVGVVS